MRGFRPAFADLLAEQVLWQARAATRRQTLDLKSEMAGYVAKDSKDPEDPGDPKDLRSIPLHLLSRLNLLSPILKKV